MKVTIKGNLEQVTEALSASALKPKTPRHERAKEKAAEREEFARKRRLILKAFNKVRYSPDDREVSDKLLAALTKMGGVTNAALKLAEQVLRERS